MREYTMIREAIQDKSEAALRGYKSHDYNLAIAKEDRELREEITNLQGIRKLPEGMTYQEFRETIGKRQQELKQLWHDWTMTNVWHFMKNDLFANGIQYPLAS